MTPRNAQPTVLTNAVASASKEARDLLLELARAGFEIVHVADATEALTVAREYAAPIVLLDVDLEAIDGAAVCRGAAANEHDRDVPIILFGAKLSTDAIAAGLDAGAADCVDGSRPADEILARVRRQIHLRELQHELLESHQTLLATIQTLPDSLLAVDSDGNVYPNESYGQRWLGQPKPDAVTNVRDFLPEHPARVFLDAIGQAVSAEASPAVTFSLPAPDGDRWIALSVAARGSSGRFVAFARDVTEHQLALQERERLENKLRRDEKTASVARLAAGVSHDLANIFGEISSFASNLQSELGPGSELLDDADKIIEACWKGSDLTDDLRQIDSASSKKKCIFSVQDALADVLDVVERAIPNNIAVDRQFHAADARILGVRELVGQTLINLAINAIDAMGTHGRMTVATSQHPLGEAELTGYPELDPGVYVALAVTDTGIGMEPETVDRAFEPFFSTKRSEDLPGLGLSIVDGIVRNHGGAVRIDSRPGAGTTVTVLFPAAIAESAGQTASPDAQGVPRSGAQTVLVVDDEELVRIATRKLLRTLGYAVVLAQSGAEALQIYRRKRSDISVVLLDLVMPTMDGRETLRKLRELDADSRVVICSGYAEDSMVRELLHEGANGFLKRPFDASTIVARIEAARR